MGFKLQEFKPEFPLLVSRTDGAKALEAISTGQARHDGGGLGFRV